MNIGYGYIYHGDPEDGIDFGSCERCGCDLDEGDKWYCDQCRWWIVGAVVFED